MDYEKEYKEALERARDVYTYYCDDREQLRKIESIFPVLKESEDERVKREIIEYIKTGTYRNDWLAWLEKQGQVKDSANFQHENKMCKENGDSLTNEDERIRKALIEYFNEQCDMSDWNGVYGYQVVAWLEKQGGQKPAWSEEELKENTTSKSEAGDKIEPRFKVGDWVVANYSGKVSQVVAVSDDGYGYYLNDGLYFSGSWCDTFHLWSIKDARDGDVLQLGKVTAIFKELIGNEHCKCYCSICNGEFEIPSQDGADNDYGCYNAAPATKEQWNTLRSKMKEAGYEWDSEKK